MAKIGRIEVTVDLLKLVQGEIVLPELRLAQPDLLLETRADGPPNWQFGEGERHVSQGRPPCRASVGWKSAMPRFATTISAADGTSPPSSHASRAAPTPT